MLSKRIIACLDIDEGRVVKGVSFRGLRDAGDPVELALRHAEAGADELVLLDISATGGGRASCIDVIRRVGRELFIPFTVGGGIRSLAQAAAVVEAGADKVTVNSAAVRDPCLIDAIAARYGSQAVVVAIDAKLRRDRQGWEVWLVGGSRPTGRDVLAWAREAAERGAGEVLLTSMDRDGTGKGFDCELTAGVASTVRIPVIASGGAGRADHFAAVFREGRADAALAASIFHYGQVPLAGLKRQLARQGIAVRSTW